MDEETKTVEQTEQQTTETVGDSQNPGGAELTFDQMLDSNPAYRSEFDRRNVKAVETARKKWEAAQVEEQDEAKRLEKMTAAQRERYQLDKDRAAFDAQRASFAAEQMRVTVGVELQKRGLDASFAKYLSGKTAEESTANLEEFEGIWNKAISATVTDRMRGGGAPKAPKGGAALTRESIKKMSRSEINANWDAIQKTLSQEKG